MPESKVKKDARLSHWSSVSDERLIDLDFEIDNPEVLAGLVRQVPANYGDAHVEFKYDLRGADVPEFTCVHGSHQHKAGFVMNVGGVRFMVGWICAKAIYNEDFDRYTADFEAAIGRRDALRRVRELRDAMAQFSAWLDKIGSSNVLEAFARVNKQLENHMPWVFQTLQAANGREIEGITMPRALFMTPTDIEGEFGRLMIASAAATLSLTGDAQRVAASLGKIRTEIDGLVRRTELILKKLADLELFFQPSTLEAICQHAEKAVPRRSKHFASQLKLSTRNVSIEMPKDFKVPSSAPVQALRAALGDIAPIPEAKGPTIVNVSGQRCTVRTHQKSKTTWVASGDYNGVRHTEESRTEGDAVARWQKWAAYKANSRPFFGI
ncbi:hypothetical protein [Afipia sp. GAS231]|uniref:hypothetical protein n=1 Tax=Afipia sp. GAS231 TaxID=1882747 RepID=UPI000879C184|nr:hypothetical protein [Afipia sp. GAS231]SDO49204.1 hypothetical protein SAMN05444050_4266 [Afipia sp. GAS231]